VKILAISGSLREASNNTALLRALAEEAPEGVEFELWNDLRSIPPYDGDHDLEPGPEPVEAFRALVRDADAVFFATPEYNSSIPGALKNALDWGSRPIATNAFRNKPVAVIGSSVGAFGGVWAAAELRKVLTTMGARVTEVDLSVSHAHEHLDENGALVNDETRQQLREALETLLAEVAPAVAA
jgi:chromate reductase